MFNLLTSTSSGIRPRRPFPSPSATLLIYQRGQGVTLRSYPFALLLSCSSKDSLLQESWWPWNHGAHPTYGGVTQLATTASLTRRETFSKYLQQGALRVRVCESHLKIAKTQLPAVHAWPSSRHLRSRMCPFATVGEIKSSARCASRRRANATIHPSYSCKA